MTTPIIGTILTVFDTTEEAIGLADQIIGDGRVGVLALRGPAPDYALKGWTVVTTDGLATVGEYLLRKGRLL